MADDTDPAKPARDDARLIHECLDRIAVALTASIKLDAMQRNEIDLADTIDRLTRRVEELEARHGR